MPREGERVPAGAGSCASRRRAPPGRYLDAGAETAGGGWRRGMGLLVLAARRPCSAMQRASATAQKPARLHDAEPRDPS
jgi:hypothetical protein